MVFLEINVNLLFKLIIIGGGSSSLIENNVDLKENLCSSVSFTLALTSTLKSKQNVWLNNGGFSWLV
nr:hypothetical protein CFP56_14293 [Quercus suber]